MAAINLQEIHDLLVEIAREGGRMMLSATPSFQKTSTKKNTTDLVTETDQAVEKMVSTRLSAAYPSFQFIGEETWTPSTILTNAPTFICDPIDGTTNFVHNFPAFCISLGFVVDKVPTVGVVYAPFFGELFTGIRGQGSFCTREGGEKIKLPYKEERLGALNTCLVSAEWGNDRIGNNFDVKVDVFRKLAASTEAGGAMVHSLRTLGSAALNTCYTATGQQDVYWEGGPWAWDMAAAWCILTEAGGMMAGGNPGEWKPELDGRLFLAVRGAEESEQRKTVEEFWGVMGTGRLQY